MIKKGKLLVEGNIQSVGYRAFVKQVAVILGIRGNVKNLPDGGVGIEFEAPSHETYEKFLQMLDRKAKRADSAFSINVTKVTPVEVRDIGKFTFKGLFSIEYGMDLDPFQKESLERQEIGILVLSDFDSKTQENFGVMENRYGAISKSLEELKTGLLQELGEAIKIFGERQK
jgi:acylphosphatase